MTQPTLFDSALAQKAAQAGMDKALSGQDDRWKAEVLGIIKQVAMRQELLTSDDVYKVITERGLGYYCARAIGPLMLRAAKAGYIESTRTVRHSERVSMHAAFVTLWRSLIVRGN